MRRLSRPLLRFRRNSSIRPAPPCAMAFRMASIYSCSRCVVGASHGRRPRHSVWRRSTAAPGVSSGPATAAGRGIPYGVDLQLLRERSTVRSKTRAGDACAKRHRICVSLTGRDEPRPRHAGTAASRRAGPPILHDREPARAPIRQQLFLAAGIGLGCGFLNVAAKAAPSAPLRGIFRHSAGSCIPTIYGLRPGLHRTRGDRLRLAVCSARYSRCLSRRQVARGGRRSPRGSGRIQAGGLARKTALAGRAIAAGSAPAGRTERAAGCPALPCLGGRVTSSAIPGCCPWTPARA